MRNSASAPIALRHGAFDNDTLAECFAVINETIRRRIGAWQVFDPAYRSLGH